MEGVDKVTQIRERAFEMLERLPDEKMIYVFNILQNIEALSADAEKNYYEQEEDAFDILMKYSRTLSENFDYKTELADARMDKYGSIN